MMTSEPDLAFVWVWLPGALGPVVAGRLDVIDGVVWFAYGRSYLENPDAIPLYLPELPLGSGPIAPLVGDIAGCIADAGPDSWGQRVILNRRLGAEAVDTAQLGRLTYLLESGSDRIRRRSSTPATGGSSRSSARTPTSRRWSRASTWRWSSRHVQD